MSDKISNYQKWSSTQTELEKKFISCFIYNKESTQNCMEALQLVQPMDFRAYKQHFEAAMVYFKGNRELSIVAEEFGVEFSFINFTDFSSSFDLPRFAGEIKTISRVLRTMETLERTYSTLSTKNIEESLGQLQQEIIQVSSSGSHETIDIAPLMDAFTAEQEVFRKLPPGGIIGLSTGFKKIDDSIDGIRAPHLWIIAGYTNIGKSSFALNILTSVLKQQKKAVFYSLEMGKMDIISRLMGIATNTNGMQIRKGQESDAVSQAKDFFKGSSLKIINEKRDLNQILLSMTEQNMRGDVDVFFLDYFQNVATKEGDTEYDSMRKTAIEFQKIAEKIGKPIICLSQISNEAAKTPSSAVMGFKGSGTIAAAADFAVELVSAEDDVEAFRTKIMSGMPVKIHVIIKKNRHGRTGKVTLDFNGTSGKFFEEGAMASTLFPNDPERQREYNEIEKEVSEF